MSRALADFHSLVYTLLHASPRALSELPKHTLRSSHCALQARPSDQNASSAHLPGFASPDTFCKIVLLPPFLVVIVHEMLSHSSVTCFCLASSCPRDPFLLCGLFFLCTRCLTRPMLRLPMATGPCIPGIPYHSQVCCLGPPLEMIVYAR